MKFIMLISVKIPISVGILIFVSRIDAKSESFKGIYLSNALTCMKCFLNKQKGFPIKRDGSLWSNCCMNNLYISHRSINVPTCSFGAICSMRISLFRVTSWLDAVWNIVTRGWTLEKTVAWTWATIIRLQYLEIFSLKCTNFWWKIYIYNCCWFFLSSPSWVQFFFSNWSTGDFKPA